METTTKHCPSCDRTLPITDFSKSKNRKDGHNPTCKHCNKLYREKNKLVLAQKKKEYYSRPDIVVRERESKRLRWLSKRETELPKMREYYTSLEGRKQRHLNQINQRCKERGLEFDLTIADIIIPEKCPLLDIPLTTTLGSGMCLSNTSIDRIDPTKGYTKDNIQVISLLANQMKNCATKEQLITFAKNILRIYNALPVL